VFAAGRSDQESDGRRVQYFHRTGTQVKHSGGQDIMEFEILAVALHLQGKRLWRKVPRNVMKISTSLCYNIPVNK
jgi:hypothetical protein